MLAFLLLPLVSPIGPQTPTHPLNGILNGDFERLQPSTNPVTSVDGGFWIGGEGRTFTEGLPHVRFFRVPAMSTKFAYQRVGVAPDRTDSVTLGADVRVLKKGDEARVTLSEGNRSHDSLSWTFKSADLCSYNQWEFFEETTPGTLQPMAVRDCDPAGSPVVSAHGTTNSCAWNRANVSPDAALYVTWTAPEAGTVRIIVRPWRSDPTTPAVEQQILFDTNEINVLPPATWIRTDQLAGDDGNGPVILERKSVLPGNRIVFRLSQPSHSGTAQLMWYPTIAYEGRRLTYRFGNSLLPANDPPNPFLVRPATVGAWTTVSISNAAADFQAAHGSYPAGPLDVELSGCPSNAIRADFDNVQCVTKADDVTETSLRDMILAEARWARDNWRKVRDRVSAGGTRMLGLYESPYWAYFMNVVAGPDDTDCMYDDIGNPIPVIGMQPVGLWDLLERVYDEQDYEDFFWMREQEVQNLSPIAVPRSLYGLPYSSYDCCADQYLLGSANYPLGVEPSYDADLYERTNDPTLLDRGYAVANVFVDHGVIGVSCDPDPGIPTQIPPGFRDGLIWTGKYNIDSGVLISGSLDNWLQLRPPTTIVRAYVQCRKFNSDHPWIQPPRYDNAKLDLMLTTAKNAIDRAKVIKRWPFDDSSWGGHWHTLFGTFNDNFGYMSRDAWPAYEALASLSSPTPDETATRDLLRNDILLSGCNHFLPLWEQTSSRNDMNASDSPRPWPAYLRMIGVPDVSDPLLNPDRTRYANQLVNAAFACVNFQYPGGIWTMAGQDPFQLVNLSGGFGGGKRAVEMFFEGMSTTLALPSTYLSAARKVDLMTEMYEMQRINQAHYKATYGYHDQVDYGPGHDNLAGPEWRTLAKLLIALDTLDEVLPDPPSAEVLTPTTNLAPEPAVGQPLVFRFRIQVPTAANAADLQFALENRTRIDKWTYPGGGAMAVQNKLWTAEPASHASFSTPVYDTLAQTATIDYLVPQEANTGKFKFTIRSWDPDGQWDRDTSYQEWIP